MTGEVDKPPQGFPTNPLVGELAHSVVDYLVEKPGRARVLRIEAATQLIYSTSLSQPGLSNGQLRTELAGLRLTDPDCIEDCIAAAVRRLGDDWLDDTRSFAEVARASAQILSFCRDISWRWDNLRPRPHCQSVLVATIEPEMHLIGPTILAQQLRRSGHSVSLLCNVSAPQILRKLSSNTYDGVMISLASTSGLERVADTIKELRSAMGASLAISVGGAVLDFLGEADKSQLDADLVTNDKNEALAMFRGASGAQTLGAAQ